MFRFRKKKQVEKEKKVNEDFDNLIENFDVEAYLEANPDVKVGIESGHFKDALHHLETFGFDEIKRGIRQLKLDQNIECSIEENDLEIIPGILRKSIFEAFFQDLNTSKYLESNLDILKALSDNVFYDLSSHFELVGIEEMYLGRRSLFTNLGIYNEEVYLSNFDDVVSEINEGKLLSGFEHYLLFGYKEESRKIFFEEITNQNSQTLEDIELNTAMEVKFDIEYYRKNNPDVVNTAIDLWSHYTNSGEKEGRQPNQYFDPNFYLQLNSDVRIYGVSAFKHFIETGYNENRLGISPLKPKKRENDKNKPLLFIGHDGIQAGSEIVLLEIIKWYCNHTNRKIKILLLSSGPVANLYAHYAEVYVLPNFTVDNEEVLKSFLDEDFEFIYFNTVVSGLLFDLIQEHNILLRGSIIVHIHEMERVIGEYKREMSNLLQYTNVWISASPASSKVLIKKFNIAKKNVVTIPAFINTVAKDQNKNLLQAEARKILGVSEDAFVVTGCGTLYWRKGPDLFIEAARHIKKNTDKKIEFIWIGDGSDKDELLDALSEEEKQYIRFIGNRTDASKMLAVGDIFFLSSREDPFPLVVLESAQHNIPTVCFAPATGITTFLEKDAGISVKKIDAIMAADAILKLMEDPRKVELLGNTAREKLFSTYTTEQQNIKIYETIKNHTDYKPSVSVIVPFYNHENFIEERIDSILNQQIKDIEIILLDDFSTDNTVEKVHPYLEDIRISLYKNKKNSGSPFKQWEKGISLAQSDFVWIAEGDDTCSDNFLQTLLPYFDDTLVNIVAAKTEIIDEEGVLQKNALDTYLNSIFFGKFDHTYKRDGFVEVDEQFGAMCTLVNASGLLIRKKSFGNMLEKASGFKMVGDWLIYLDCLKNGKVAYDVDAKNYFRRHSASAVHKIEGTKTYFKEREAVTNFVIDNFNVSHRLLKKAFQAIDHEWDRFKYKHPDKVLNNLYNKQKLLKKSSITSDSYHVAFYVHGMMFSQGGIERLAADLSNHLVKNGNKVTIFCRAWGNQDTSVYPLYNSVKVIPIFDEHRQEDTVKELRKKLLRSDVDVFVPMLSEWLFEPIISAAEDTGIPIIASEHNDPWKIEELWWDHDKRVSYFEKVDKIHLLLNKFVKSLPKSLSKKIDIIPNGVNILDNIPNNQREKLIIGVGRLAEQKRFDRLIEAVLLIQDELREEKWRVEIYGEGHLRSDLQNQINELGVNDLIRLCGETDKIDEVLTHASVYVMTSEFEGFGIALVEAMSFGVPSIGFKDCNGPNEIIRDKKDGYLVKDTNDLSIKLLKFVTMKDKKYMIKSKSAFERAREYSMENFYMKWTTLLESTIKEIEVK